MSFLNEPCLWLNRNWQVIGFFPVRTSIENLCRDMASVMDPETYELLSFERWQDHKPRDARYISTASRDFPVPEVIVLKEYGERPPRRISFGRANLARRDDFTCQYCGKKLNLGRGSEKVTIDHVLPRSRGGPNTWENTVASCERCNNRKADRTGPPNLPKNDTGKCKPPT